jgi:hypothetical protein
MRFISFLLSVIISIQFCYSIDSSQSGTENINKNNKIEDINFYILNGNQLLAQQEYDSAIGLAPY